MDEATIARIKKRQRDDRQTLIASYVSASSLFLAVQLSWYGAGLPTNLWFLILPEWVAIAVATFYFPRALRDVRSHFSVSFYASWTAWYLSVIPGLITLQWSWHV